MYLLVPGGFIFGWAKPIPVITRNFKDVRMGMRMVAIAGPLANLLMAVIWAFLWGLSTKLNNSFHEPLFIMASFGFQFNVMLFVLNMLPILPLDGGRFLDTFLPARASMQFQKIEPYGTWIILILLFTKILSIIMFPAMLLIMMPIQALVGLFFGTF
jgi:Zn-dependent protease